MHSDPNSISYAKSGTGGSLIGNKGDGRKLPLAVVHGLGCKAPIEEMTVPAASAVDEVRPPLMCDADRASWTILVL